MSQPWSIAVEHAFATPADTAADVQVELRPEWRVYDVATVFNAPDYDKTWRLDDGGEVGSVAGSDATDISRASTVLLAALSAISASCKLVALHGAGFTTSPQQITPRVGACKPTAARLMVHRHMDTHQPVKVGGGHGPPQDRPPPAHVVWL